jgi:hypothetical protein
VQDLPLALEKIAGQSALLRQVDPVTRYTIPGAAKELSDVATELQSAESANPKGIHKRLQTALTLMEVVVGKAKSLAEKATDAGKAAVQLVAQLEPVMTHLGTLVVWAAKL